MGDLKINTNLSTEDYGAVVNALVDSYFDPNGEYAPHFGRLNQMALFYNVCVKDGELKKEIGDIVSGLEDIEKLLKNENFMEAYDYTINSYVGENLNFHNAITDAFSIIEHKKSSMSVLADYVTKLFTSIAQEITSMANNSGMANDVVSAAIDYYERKSSTNVSHSATDAKGTVSVDVSETKERV